MKSTLHTHIRKSVIITWLVVWNMLMGIGIWANGGLGRIHSTLAKEIAATALFGSAGCVLAILLIPTVRDWALRPDAQFSSIQKQLWFHAALFSGMGLAMLITLATES
jgi:hypothetical protein